MNKIIGVWNKLTKNDNFLKILSVIIAVIVWLCIVNIANPTNEKEFKKVPIQINYEGSTPERNGLMMLLSDTNLYVNMIVEGPRSRLVTLTNDDINAYLNLESIVAPGTYNVQISTYFRDSQFKVKEFTPTSYFTIEFAKKTTKDIPITLSTSGNLPLGYEAVGQTLSRDTVRVTGPEEIVNSIKTALITIDITDQKQTVTQTGNVRLINEQGESVDTKYLTIEPQEIESSVDIAFRKIVPINVELINSFGGSEKDYAKITYSKSYIELQGNEEFLNNINEINLGQIFLEQMNTDSKTFSFDLPEIENVSYILPDNNNKIDITVELGETATKTLRFSKSEMTKKFSFSNVPPGASPTIDESSFSIVIRAPKNIISSIDKETFSYTIDMSARNDKGLYKVVVAFPDNIIGGIMNACFININY